MSSGGGFVHSVKVPRIYKSVANIARRVGEEGASLKGLISEQKHTNTSGVYALTANTLQFSRRLDELFQRTEILAKEPRLDPWLAKVLVAELLWGKKQLPGTSKPVQTILAYADKLRKESKSLGNTERPSIPKIAQKPRYVRINTLLILVDDAISLFQEEGWKLLPRSTTYSSYLQSLSQLSEPYFLQDFHIPEVLAFPPSTCFFEHTGYKNNEFILQDKASCLPAHLLDPVKGSVVLDFCASPGMKTTHLAAKLQNNGKIYAVEIDSKRFETLCSQIEKTHSLCVEPLNQDALTLTLKSILKQYRNRVEYILVDPSCSGSGIVDRLQFSGADNEPDPKRLQNLQSFQVYLLRHALFNFPTVKRVVYSTCSLQPEENELVIDEVLADIGDAYRLVPIKDLLKDNWINFSSQKYNCGDRCLYSRPEVDFCTGFFMAVFERNFEVPLPECRRKGGNVKSLENIDTNTELNDSTENVSRKRKKRGKKKKNKNTQMNDEQVTKTSEDGIEISKTESGKTGKVCSESSFNTEEIILNEPKNDWESLKNTETKKLRKKNEAKQEHVINKKKKDKKMMEIEKNAKIEEKGETISIELPKHKKKKKKKDKEAVEIDNDVRKDEENEKILIEPPKKKRKKMKKINTIEGQDENKLRLDQ